MCEINSKKLCPGARNLEREQERNGGKRTKKPKNESLFRIFLDLLFRKKRSATSKRLLRPLLILSLSLAMADEINGAPLLEASAAAPAAEAPSSSSPSADAPSTSSSTSTSPSLLSLSVKNPARSCAPDFVLTARADDSVAELKTKLSQTYEGKPPVERQTVRKKKRRNGKGVFFANGSIVDLKSSTSTSTSAFQKKKTLANNSSSTPGRCSRTTRRSSQRC